MHAEYRSWIMYLTGITKVIRVIHARLTKDGSEELGPHSYELVDPPYIHQGPFNELALCFVPRAWWLNATPMNGTYSSGFVLAYGCSRTLCEHDNNLLTRTRVRQHTPIWCFTMESLDYELDYSNNKRSRTRGWDEHLEGVRHKSDYRSGTRWFWNT